MAVSRQWLGSVSLEAEPETRVPVIHGYCGSQEKTMREQVNPGGAGNDVNSKQV